MRAGAACLARRFARRSLGSVLLRESPLPTFEESCRLFSSGVCSLHRGLSNEELKPVRSNSELLHAAFCMRFHQTRSFHGTSAVYSRNYYDVLGVNKNANASEIKNAYYALAKKLHPDANKNDEETVKKFQEVQLAYEVLKDKEKRSIYDQVGHEGYERVKGGDGPGFNPFEDIFNSDFMNNIFHERGYGGEDVQVSLEISFMEAVQGCSKTVTFSAALKCGACGGTGVPPGTRPETCRSCRGSGATFMQEGPFKMQITCSQCGGSGKFVKSLCKSCKGHKVVQGMKTVKVDVMPGVDNEEKIKIYRNGGADPEGDRPGDLYVIVKIREDPVFRRERADIHVDAILNVTQAMLGGTIRVPTLTGDAVLKVKPGTQPGQKVVLKGKGIKTRGSNHYGNQYVHFNLTIPVDLTQQQRTLIEEFARLERGKDENVAAVAGASG